MLTFLLLFLPLFSISLGKPYINTPYTNINGLFYNHLGNAKLSSNTLTLLTYINFTYLQESLTIANNFFSRSSHLCQLTTQGNIEPNHVNFHCDVSLKIIKDSLSQLKEKDEILSELTEGSHKRYKRGLVNGVSYAFNWLFGMPDAEDAKFYSESIHNLMNDNKQTQTLLKSQIQIISSTIENFNTSVISLKRSENEMNHNLALINKYNNEANNNFKKLNLETLITQQITTLNSLINKLNNEFDNYINAINLGKHGIISPQILTPKALFEEIKNFKGDHELPINVDHSTIHLYYKIMSLDITESEHMIIFAFKIPLVLKNIYNLFKLIPLPIQHSNSSYYTYIEPSHPYLLLSQNKILYTFLQDIADCREYVKGQYLCKEVHMNVRNDQSNCEVQLMSAHVKKIPEDCRTKKIKATFEVWNYIGTNQWLYILQNPTTLTLMCTGNHMEDVVLHQTGLIKLQPKCKGYTNMVVLETSNEESKNITHHVPSLDIQVDCCVQDFKEEAPEVISLKPIHLTNLDLHELNYANSKLNEMDQIITNQLNKDKSYHFYSWYTVLLLVIGALVFLVICINCCKWWGCLNLIRKLCCFTRNPRNGEIIPPIIKTFVNCTFDSDLRKEYHNRSRDVVLYNTEREVIQSRVLQTVGEEEEELQGHNYNLRPLTSRRSTTPL